MAEGADTDANLEASTNAAQNTSGVSGRPDTLNSEFLYYSSVLKILASTLSNEKDKQKIMPWVRKLFRPEYHSAQFREKRNRYLLYLTLTLLNDEAYGIFSDKPPEGALPEIEEIPVEAFPAAAWEMDTTWGECLDNLSSDFQRLKCSVHDNAEGCNFDHNLDKILDQEFHFLLYLAKPFAALLTNTHDRTRVATWLQTLCSLTGPKTCSSMRGIRNDYMMALLGYIQHLRLVGPFAKFPPIKTLPPLAEAAKLAKDTPLTDPTGSDATEFLAGQPVPTEARRRDGIKIPARERLDQSRLSQKVTFVLSVERRRNETKKPRRKKADRRPNRTTIREKARCPLPFPWETNGRGESADSAGADKCGFSPVCLRETAYKAL